MSTTYMMTRCFVLLAVLAGSAVYAADGETAAEEQSKPAAPSPRDYAYAMERLEPLARIRGGDDVSVCDAEADQPERYADAVDYAESMGSYSLIIWKEGECQLDRYFAPFDRDIRPESASMHKSVVGILIAAAIADGYIAGPDARVGDYIDAWRTDARGEITVRQLLTMSSGLEPLSREGGMASDAMRFVLGPEDARAMSLGRPLRETPGTVFHYQ
ncbi:MAG: serine hydrolase, partial [Chromatocurvus sp.]